MLGSSSMIARRLPRCAGGSGFFWLKRGEKSSKKWWSEVVEAIYVARGDLSL